DTGQTRGVGEGEAGRTFLRNQAERRLQQRFLQIAVVVAALGAALFLAPAHVNGFYMSRAQRSLAAGTSGASVLVYPATRQNRPPPAAARGENRPFPAPGGFRSPHYWTPGSAWPRRLPRPAS